MVDFTKEELELLLIYLTKDVITEYDSKAPKWPWPGSTFKIYYPKHNELLVKVKKMVEEYK